MPAISSTTVSIACKLPAGLVMQLQREETRRDPAPNDGNRTVKVFAKYGDKYTLNGFSRSPSLNPKLVVGGFAITSNIPKDFAEEWFKQNADFPPVKRGFVKMFSSDNMASGYASEHEKMKSGYEPTDPNDLPEEFRGRIEKADVR